MVCEASTPIKCEDGSCQATLSDCQSSLDQEVQACLKSKYKFYCFLNGQCMDSISDCQTLSVSQSPCPSGTVYNYSSSQCLSQFTLSTDISCTGAEEVFCGGLNDASCQAAPCTEWTECPSGQSKCDTGQCVTDLSVCPVAENGCPFDLPIRC